MKYIDMQNKMRSVQILNRDMLLIYETNHIGKYNYVLLSF